MERTSSTKEVQGGGSGEGMVVPTSISNYEPTALPLIFSDMIQTLRLKERNQLGLSDLPEDCWKTAIQNRARELCRRKRAVGAIATDTIVKIDEQIRDMGGSAALCSTVQSENSHRSEACQPASSSSAFRSVPVEARQESFVLEKLVPALPKRMEDVIILWRHGTDQTGSNPLRVFMIPENRKHLMRNYSNKAWTNSGQKRAFQRLKKLCSVVAVCFTGTEPLKISEHGDDEDWDAALASFHEAYDSADGPLPLSNVLTSILPAHATLMASLDEVAAQV